MPVRKMKYNPAFITEQELVDTFVVRHDDLETILQVIRENTGDSNQHVLVIGPRGSGKTTLVLRAVAELRRSEDLSKLWYPVVFGEESYQVTSPGEFWLEAIFHLAHQTKDDKWQKTHEELRGEPVEERLRERALGQLLDFAASQKRRLLLVVENFNMLLAEQFSDDDAWVLRHTLANEPRIMLLASAPTRFDETQNSGKAMFELFKQHTLHPLNLEECQAVWESVSGETIDARRIRPIQILTGGNPRLLTIIAQFGAGKCLQNLMGDLLHLVDEHTEYFKSHLDSLPPVERKVYVALAEIWDPATARQVAAKARIDVSKTSALIRRLIERGAVTPLDEAGNVKLYQLSERLYNIYYLMRRRGTPSDRVRAVVRFIVSFYAEQDLQDVVKRICQEALQLPQEARQDHLSVIDGLVGNAETLDSLKLLIESIPKDLHLSGKMPTVRKVTEQITSLRERILQIWSDFERMWIWTTMEWVGILRKWEETERNTLVTTTWGLPGIKKARFENIPWSRYSWLPPRSMTLKEYERDLSLAVEEMALVDSDLAGRARDVVNGLLDLASTYVELKKVLSDIVTFDKDDPALHLALAQACERIGLVEEAEAHHRENVRRFPSNAEAWHALGRFLCSRAGYNSEAIASLERAVDLKPEDLLFLWNLATAQQAAGQLAEAETTFRRILESSPGNWPAMEFLGDILVEKGDYSEAAKHYRKAVQLDSELGSVFVKLLRVLLVHMRNPRKAMTCLRERKRELADLGEEAPEVALLFLDHADGKTADKALELILQGEQGSEDEFHRDYVRVLLAAARGHHEEVAIGLAKHLSNPETIVPSVERTTDLLVRLAAVGLGEEAVKALSASPCATLLEPVEVGLNLFLKRDVTVASEILEIGKDVCAKVQKISESLSRRR